MQPLSLFADDSELLTLIQEYFSLTQDTMPKLANQRGWPIRFDHCFQRVVLDTVCQGIWYESIRRPAYRHMTESQLKAAVNLCQRIIQGDVCLERLNNQSLNWRGKPVQRAYHNG